MSRIRANFLGGIIGADLAIGITTLTSSQLNNFPVITAPDVGVIVLDPDGGSGNPEIVYVTAHTSTSSSATILRAQEGTAARAYLAVDNVAWRHVATVQDWNLKNDISTVNAQTVGAVNLTLNAALGNIQKINLTANQGGNTTTITNPVGGLLLIIEWWQGTGSHTYAWPSSVRFAGNTAPVASTGANVMDAATFRYSTTAALWLEEGRAVNVPTT